jgi:hypothetical protein
MRVVSVTVDFTFTYNSEVGKVRTISPPEEFDDKGNIKKHTKEELLPLKGDTPEEKKLPGYKSDISEVQVGDLVRVALSVHRTKARAGTGKKAQDPDADAAGPDGGKWVVVNQLLGRVTKIDAGNSAGDPKLTVRVTGQTLVPRNSRGGNVNRSQTINPDWAQATVILIGRRQPGGGLGGPGKK